MALTFGELTLNVLYLKDVDSRRLKSLYCLLSRQWTGARASHGAGVLWDWQFSSYAEGCLSA